MNKLKKILSKIINNQVFLLCTLFFTISFLYYLCNVYYLFEIRNLTFPIVIGIIGYFLYLLLNKKLDNKKIVFLILALGVALRITYAGYNNIFSRQHDVGYAYEDGHYGYALYIFRNNSLPDYNSNQFYQPPLNAILQANWMKITTWFVHPSENITTIYNAMFNGEKTFLYNNELIAYIDSLYNSCRILSCFYSCLTLLVIYKILKEFKLKDLTFYIILLMMSIQPIYVMMSGTMNNDNLSFLFFFLSLLFAIKWFKNPSYLYIILIALSIGLGMVTKLSIGFVAFIIGPMMLIKFIQKIKKKKYLNLIPQFIVFAIIVFPLGLSFAIRNYLLLDQEFTYILDFGRDSWLHEVIKEKNVFERFFSLPITQLIHTDRGIFHDYQEYNIWVDLIKTSVFEEFAYTPLSFAFCAVMYLFAIGYWLILIPSIIFVFYKIIKKTFKGNIYLLIISLSLIFLALISYIALCVKMPYSCSSNFRYIIYIALGMIVLYSFVLENIQNKKITNISLVVLGIFAISTSLFILVI